MRMPGRRTAPISSCGQTTGDAVEVRDRTQNPRLTPPATFGGKTGGGQARGEASKVLVDRRRSGKRAPAQVAVAGRPTACLLKVAKCLDDRALAPPAPIGRPASSLQGMGPRAEMRAHGHVTGPARKLARPLSASIAARVPLLKPRRSAGFLAPGSDRRYHLLPRKPGLIASPGRASRAALGGDYSDPTIKASSGAQVVAHGSRRDLEDGSDRRSAEAGASHALSGLDALAATKAGGHSAARPKACSVKSYGPASEVSADRLRARPARVLALPPGDTPRPQTKHISGRRGPFVGARRLAH